MRSIRLVIFLLFVLSLWYGCKKNLEMDIYIPETEYKYFSLNPVFEWNGWNNAEVGSKENISVFAYFVKDDEKNVTTNNAKIRFTDQVWTTDDEMRLSMENCVHEILAVYPSVKTENADIDSIMFSAYDGVFMAGKTEYNGIDGNTCFNLRLQHLVGRVNIRVVLNNEYSNEAIIKNVIVRGWKDGILNNEKISLLPIDADISKDIGINVVRDNDGHSFIGGSSVIPQKLLANDFTIIVSDKGKDYRIRPMNLQYWISVEKGKVTTVDFTAGINNLVINDVIVADWIPGYNDNGGIYLN